MTKRLLRGRADPGSRCWAPRTVHRPSSRVTARMMAISAVSVGQAKRPQSASASASESLERASLSGKQRVASGKCTRSAPSRPARRIRATASAQAARKAATSLGSVRWVVWATATRTVVGSDGLVGTVAPSVVRRCRRAAVYASPVRAARALTRRFRDRFAVIGTPSASGRLSSCRDRDAGASSDSDLRLSPFASDAAVATTVRAGDRRKRFGVGPAGMNARPPRRQRPAEHAAEPVSSLRCCVRDGRGTRLTTCGHSC